MSSITLLARETEAGAEALFRDPYLSKQLLQISRREAYLAFWAIVLAPLVIQWVRWMSRRWRPRSPFVVAGHVAGITLVSVSMWSQIVVLSWLIGWDSYPQSAAQLRDSLASLLPARIPADTLLYGLVAFWTVFRDAHQRFVAEQLRASELGADLAEARLATLQARLQPHFLYNTLHTIGSFVEQDAKAARLMLTRLGDILRATLEETRPMVALSRELEILDAYLEIQRIRFGERLEVQYEIESGLQDLLVPPLVLQPLAENAVRHALARVDRSGLVGVRAARRSDRLVLEVSDNGEGFLPPLREEGGIGLSTTRARLEVLFPGAATLELKRSPGLTVVTIEIPTDVSRGMGAASKRPRNSKEPATHTQPRLAR